MNLPVGARLTARFQAVVSATASVGTTLSARAQLFDTAGTALTKNAKADLLVQPDALMDRGTILGKVFCDEDGDGRQGPKELGVGAARVYIDTGHYSETDRAGRYHLMDIPPGNHLVKLDVNTLPPGSAMTTDVKRVVWVTRGLGQRINFGVRCEVKRARADEVVLKQAKKKAAPEPKAGPGVVHVRVNLSDLSAEVDNRKIASAHLRTMLLTDDAIRPSPLPVATTPVNLSAGAPLKIAVESEGPLTNHRVVVREVTRGGGLGVTVSSWRFRGAPSPLLVQPLAPDTLTPGRRYAVRVSASDRYGANVWGVWMPLVVPIGDVKQLNWSLPTSAPWVQLNGRRVPVDAKGRADVWIERTGRLIIGMQRSSGEGRNAYMSIGKQLSKVSVRTPKVDDRDDAKRVIGALVADESAAMSEEVTQTVMKLGAAPRPAEGEVPAVEPSQPVKTQSGPTQRQPTIASKDTAKAPKQSLPPATMTPKDAAKDTPKDTPKDNKVAASSRPKTHLRSPRRFRRVNLWESRGHVVGGEIKVTQPRHPNHGFQLRHPTEEAAGGGPRQTSAAVHPSSARSVEEHRLVGRRRPQADDYPGEGACTSGTRGAGPRQDHSTAGGTSHRSPTERDARRDGADGPPRQGALTDAPVDAAARDLHLGPRGRRAQTSASGRLRRRVRSAGQGSGRRGWLEDGADEA